jgi:archaellum component FlaC
MWLSRDETTLGSKSRNDIELILDDLEKKQSEILEISKIILNGCTEKKSHSF